MTTATVLAPTDPAELPAVFARAWNAGDADGFAGLFDADAVLVPVPGTEVRGDALRPAIDGAVRDGVPVTVTLRQVYVADDIALLINDFVHDGTGPDGAPVHLEGTVADVARRGADGRWRYLIDNPSGTARGPREDGS